MNIFYNFRVILSEAILPLFDDYLAAVAELMNTAGIIQDINQGLNSRNKIRFRYRLM